MNLATLNHIWAMETPALEKMLAGLHALRPPVAESDATTPPPIPKLPLTIVDNVAVISISGPMVRGPEWLSKYGFAITPLLTRAVQTGAAMQGVTAMLLRINSPGGSVDGLAELADAVFAARQSKEVVAQVEGMAASAAYLVASQASKIVGNRMDMVGSIGVRMTLYDYSKYFEEAGIKPVIIDTGPFKSTGELGAPVTEDQKTYLQGIVDAYFADFKAAITRGRGMTGKALDQVADGRLFLAADAIKLGLMESISSTDQALASLRQAPTASPGPAAPSRRRSAATLADSQQRAIDMLQ